MALHFVTFLPLLINANAELSIILM